ncbi:hypothetical protein HU200_035881 [Digitaria exilis]|uniref:F-box protein AT5G49610-like beta-propeller domain-containing protein n=1 Tax=Digitaria exilis TaxID=1010633 RepID=A0A835BMB2_9POAL|nr:hypothetical protein HU200_035881 [Digitaria exilis]
MDPPDHIPTERFYPRFRDGNADWDKWRIYGCRHGRVLLHNKKQNDIVVWDPLTGDHRVVAIPLEFDSEEKRIWNGAVLCAAADNPSHMHGGFSSCPFKVVLVGVTSDHTQMFVCSYSSETGNWSDLVSATIPFTVYCVSDPGTLMGNALYWKPGGVGLAILKFNLDTLGLDVIEWPSSVTVLGRGSSQILLAEDVSLGLAILSDGSLQIWKRKVCSECVTEWVLQKTHSLDKIHGMYPGTEIIIGYAEDANVMLLWTRFGVQMVQLDSMQSTKLWETNIVYYGHHPYTTIYDSTGRSLFILQYNKKNAIACSWLLNTFYTATETLAKNLELVGIFIFSLFIL